LAKIVCILVCVAFSAPLAASGQASPAGAEPPAREKPAEPAAKKKPLLKPAPPTPIAIEKQELGDPEPWNPAWDRLIEKALPADLLSPERERQVRSLCPRFKYLSDADRRAFWAYFFQALAGAEAGLEPTADVRHKEPAVAVIDPVTHRVARQEGLLQLAYMDSERYDCDFDWQKDKDLPEHDPAKTILEPRNNLLCGINILENQIVTRHKPLLSGSSYWVTLRPGTYGFQHFMKQMANEPASCGVPRVRRRWPWRRRQTPLSEAVNQTRTPTAPAGAQGAALPAPAAPAGAAESPGERASANH
jgi:hypothetical protein